MTFRTCGYPAVYLAAAFVVATSSFRSLADESTLAKDLKLAKESTLAKDSKGATDSGRADASHAEKLQSVDLRREVNDALRDLVPATAAERRQQAKTLLSLYTQTGAAKNIATIERDRLQARLRSRLTRLSDAIARDSQKIAAKQPASDGTTANEATTSNETSPPVSPGSAGGAAQNEGQALVELIQATIAPHTWDVNGGQGTIVYWPAWQVLVVRQTDDVHEQIGGAVHAMRK